MATCLFRATSDLVDIIIVVSLLPLNGCNSNRISPPKDWGSVSVTLARGHFYAVTVRGSGEVEYKGFEGVPVRGRHLSTLPAEKMTAILEAIDRSRFMSMNDTAFQNASDVPYVVVNLSVDGKNKQVRSIDTGGDHRLRMSMLWFNRGAREQSLFVKLADEIDSLIGTDRWTRCSPKCAMLVRAGTFWVDRRSSDGSTILLKAIQSKKDMSVGSVDFDPLTMIEAGVDVNASNNQGLTPLMAAAENDDVELVRDLLGHGADPNARDRKGQRASAYVRKSEIQSLLPSEVSTR